MICSRKMFKRVDDKRHTCLYSDCTEPFSRVPIHLDCNCSHVVELFHAADWICINTVLCMTVEKATRHTALQALAHYTEFADV